MGKNDKYRSRDDHPYWETVKKLPTFRAKVEYTWENWNVHILGVVFMIVLVSSILISNLSNNTPAYLSGAYINLLTVGSSTEEQTAYLDRVFLHDYLGIDENEKITMRCTTEMTMDLSGESGVSEMTNNTITRLDAMIPSNEFDYFIMTEDLANWLHLHYGGSPFLDLREFLTADELELYADRLRYVKGGIPVGFDITDSSLLADMCFTADKPVCFVWFGFVKNTDRMRPFFDFLLTTLP